MKQLILRVSDDLHRRIAARAAREGLSMNAWVSHLLEVAVDADVAQDRHARLGAQAAALGMLHIHDTPRADEETLRRGEAALRELAPEIVRILNEDRERDLL